MNLLWYLDHNHQLRPRDALQLFGSLTSTNLNFEGDDSIYGNFSGRNQHTSTCFEGPVAPPYRKAPPATTDNELQATGIAAIVVVVAATAQQLDNFPIVIVASAFSSRHNEVDGRPDQQLPFLPQSSQGARD